MRLLLAEGDSMLGSLVQKALLHAGMAVDWVFNSGEFTNALPNHHYDLIVLGLPGCILVDLLQRLRKNPPFIPTVLLSSDSNPQAKVNLLDLGADDVLIKPFDIDELTARIRVVIRRLPTDDADAGASSYGALSLFPLRYAATWNGKPISLTHREYWVLELLMRRKNQIVTRSQIEESIYGWGSEVESNTVEVYIHLLRRKLGAASIHTTRGVGYQLASLQ